VAGKILEHVKVRKMIRKRANDQKNLNLAVKIAKNGLFLKLGIFS